MKNILIGDYDKQFKSDELEYKDFISRKEFINRTGIYVSALFLRAYITIIKNRACQWMIL